MERADDLELDCVAEQLDVPRYEVWPCAISFRPRGVGKILLANAFVGAAVEAGGSTPPKGDPEQKDLMRKIVRTTRDLTIQRVSEIHSRTGRSSASP